MRFRPVTVLAVLIVLLGIGLVVVGAPRGTAVAPSPSPSGFSTSRPPTTSVPTATPGPRAIPDGYRVQIARLQIDLPLKEGDLRRDVDDQQTPEHAAFHLPGTALPGDKSNTYIYAHARQGMFLSLWNAKEGDDVLVVAPDGRTLRYVVIEVHPKVPYNEVSWAMPTPEERLTLQTSTGPNPHDPRFVVVAKPR